MHFPSTLSAQGFECNGNAVTMCFAQRAFKLQVSIACPYRMLSQSQAYARAHDDALRLLRRSFLGEVVHDSARIDIDFLQSRALVGRLSPTS